MRSQLLWDMSDMAKAPRQVARARENMENTIIHTGPWHTELLRECTQGSLVQLVQSAKDLNKLQRYLSGHWMVNDAKLEFHPNIKQHHVLQTTFFSDQGGSWHSLQYICRVASVAQPPWVYRFEQNGRRTSTGWKSKSGTLLLQLPHGWSCAWQVSTPSKFTTAWWLASKLIDVPLAMKCQINNQKTRTLRTQQTWIALGLGILK